MFLPTPSRERPTQTAVFGQGYALQAFAAGFLDSSYHCSIFSLLAREIRHQAALRSPRSEITGLEATQPPGRGWNADPGQGEECSPRAGGGMHTVSLGAPLLQLQEKMDSVFISIFCLES